jgi:hypothetical protein
VHDLNRKTKQKFEDIVAFLSFDSNYKTYRETVAQDGQTTNASMVVPFLPPHLRDILTIHEVCFVLFCFVVVVCFHV